MIKQVLGRIYRKTVRVKQRLGFYGDILVFFLVYWLVKTYVPYGQLLVDAVFWLFAAMFAFSVLYIVYLNLRQR